MAFRRFSGRRRITVKKRSLHWTASCNSNSSVINGTTDTAFEWNLLLLAADIGPGAGQVIEADGVTITRIVGSIRWDAIPVFDVPADNQGYRAAFGIVKTAEPLDTTILPDLESQDDLSTFDWLHVRYLSGVCTQDWTPDRYHRVMPNIDIDTRVQRKFNQQDSLQLYGQVKAPVLAPEDQITFTYRWDLRILLRMR